MAGALRACEDAAGNFATYLMLQFGEGQGTPSDDRVESETAMSLLALHVVFTIRPMPAAG
jgi:hypothetical protein